MAKVAITSLGCPRNLVDSEIILGSLKEKGFEISDIEEGADISIVNTCSFIESAREESIDTILEAARLKKEGRIKYLVVCGCLPQLYKDKLAKALPEIDLILGTTDFSKIKSHSPRFSLTPKHYAYVKVSEGCDNLCSYCIISHIRGRFRSRTIESIIEEIGVLSEGGALKELNLIGQDTTQFGIDRCGKIRFPELLKRISRLKNSIRWIRILYTHPAHYTDELISAVRDERKICKYLDLPIQHISDKILKKMNRHTTRSDIITLIEDLRKNIPGLVLRTSVIVGFPSETDKDFKELLGFLEETRFERLGAFLYSKEKDTKALRFKNQIPEKEKKARFDEVMKLQQKVSEDINKSWLGRTAEVLIDEHVEGEVDRFLGRTQADAPEVDGNVYVSGKGLKTGEFYSVKITDTLEYDLVGEAI